MKKQDRDVKGHFLGFDYYKIQGEIKADNERAQKIVKLCDALGVMADLLGLKQLESGNWRIDFRGDLQLVGLAWGITVALHKKPKELLRLLAIVADALGWTTAEKIKTKMAETKSRSASARASA